jgi:VanZ family protein
MTASIKLLPAIAWFILTLILLTLPGKDLPQIGWMENLPVDKVIHIFLFFVLVTLFFWGIVSTKPGTANKRVLVFIALTALLYGIAMEFVQKYWVPNRSFDEWDIVADGVGSFLPLLLVAPIMKMLRIRSGKQQV